MSTCLLDSAQRGRGPLVLSRMALLLIALMLFLVVHLLLRLLAPASLHRDDAELLIFNQALAWGYSEQPPLYSWIYFFLARGLGQSLFTLTLMRLLFVAGFVWFLYLAAWELFEDLDLAMLAGASGLAVPVVAWHALTYLTHSLLLCCLCAATLWLCARIAKFGRTRDYLLLGLCAGLGMLSKYNYPIFLGCLVMSAWTVAPLRRRFLDLRLLLAGGLAMLIFLPHGFWLWENAAYLKAEYQHKGGVGEAALWLGLIPKGVWDLFSNAAILVAPTLAIFALLFPSVFRSGPANGVQSLPSRRWLGRFLLAVMLVHLAYIFAAGASRFHERWLEPFALFFPLYLLAGLAATKAKLPSFRKLIAFLIFSGVCLTLARGGQIWLGGSRGDYSPIDSDYRVLSQRLQDEVPADALLVAQDTGLGGNLRLQMPNWSCVSLHSSLYRAPAETGPRYFVLIWDEEWGQEVPAWFTQRVTCFAEKKLVPVSPIRQINLPPVALGRQHRTLLYLLAEQKN